MCTFFRELERQVKTQRLSKKRKYSSGDDEEGGPDSSDEGSDEGEMNVCAVCVCVCMCVCVCVCVCHVIGLSLIRASIIILLPALPYVNLV